MTVRMIATLRMLSFLLGSGGAMRAGAHAFPSTGTPVM